MNLTIAGLTARGLLGRRRVLLLLPMPILLIGLTLIAHGKRGVNTDWGPLILGDLGLGVVLPLTALIVGSAVLGLEIEDGTITHILAKPLPRSEIVVSKLVVAWAVTTVAAAVPLVIAGAIAGSWRFAIGLGCGATVGALAYSAMFLALSLVSRRPVGIGLMYIMLWESLLAKLIGGTKVLSVQQYSATIADAIGDSNLLKATVPVLAAAILAGVFVAGGTLIATLRLRSFSLTGETS